MEFTLLWAALTAVVAAWLGLKVWDSRVPPDAMDRLVTAAVVALVVGRLIAMMFQGTNPLTHPGDIIVVRGGVDTGTAALAFVSALVWSTRRIGGALDAVVPAVLAGLAGWHAGCLWRGACLGTPSELPWSWTLGGSAISRHPVELYAALGLVAGAFVVSRLGWRPYLRFGAGMALAGAIRLITQPLRPSLTGGPVGWYIAAIVLGGLAIVFGPRVVKSTAPT